MKLVSWLRAKSPRFENLLLREEKRALEEAVEFYQKQLEGSECSIQSEWLADKLTREQLKARDLEHQNRLLCRQNKSLLSALGARSAS